MINIEFEPGEAILPPPAAFNTYKLTVNYIHGDGDGYSEAVNTYDAGDDHEVAQLKLHIIGLFALQKACHLRGIDELDLIPLFEAQSLTSQEASDAADEFADLFGEGDNTCDGDIQASCDGFELTYYDDNGNQSTMGILVNGRRV